MTLLGGTRTPTMGSLQLRKREDGVTLDADAPDIHQFPRKFLTRELNDAVEIRVTVRTDPAVSYRITAISEDGDLTGNKLPTPKPTAKRRWWQRKDRG